jgi:Myb-like DNA-binding domain
MDLSFRFYAPCTSLPYTFPSYFYEDPMVIHSGCSNPSTEKNTNGAGKKKYHRTWTKTQVEEVFVLAIQYSKQVNKRIDDLTLNDFGVIAIGLEQTPQQVMHKIREINTNGTLRPGKWSQVEDDLLVSLIQQYSQNWGKIANHLNAAFHNRLNIRNSKTCKERWNNYLNPNIKRGEWTDQEDILLLEGYLLYGNKWISITKKLENRIESSVKNRVKSILHKIHQDLKSKINKNIEDVNEKIREIIKEKKKILSL